MTTTILIADDQPANRSLLTLLFEGPETTLLEAQDGRDALALAQQQPPDLVITDILMPRMNGVELVQRLRGEPKLADVPVIFYTATYRTTEARALADACGVQWVLGKPSDPELILATAEQALGRPLASGERGSVRPAAGGDGAPCRGIHGELVEYLSQLEATHAAMAALLERGRTLTHDGSRLGELKLDVSHWLHRLQSVSLRLTPLIELGLDMAAERDPQRLLEMMCRGAHNVCVCRFAVAAAVDERDSRPRHLATRGLPEARPAWAAAPPAAGGVLAALLEEQLPQRFNGLPGDPAGLGLPPDHPAVHSFLAVPLVARGRSLGWLYLVDKLGADGFSEAEEQIANTVASQCAVAYENLLLYDEVARLAGVLEQRVQESTAQLRRANADLAAFNASVSHDLRQPLRGMRGLAELLQRRHGDALPPESGRFLQQIVDAGAHMDRLITDLLTYARIGGNAAMAPVPLALLLDKLAASQRAQPDFGDAVIAVAPGLPAVRGHPTLLQEVFANLLDNALKFRRDGEPARVDVGWAQRGESCVVTVRDNGIGIAPEHLPKLFGMFQRVHTVPARPGTGIGLALVKKAVERMGGEVWAESVVGGGSSFNVSLPLAQAVAEAEATG